MNEKPVKTLSQRMKNQSRDLDWSKDDKPAKFNDDAVAEENYCWGLVAPPPVAYRWKWLLNMGKIWSSHFLPDWTMTIRNVSIWRSFITIKGLDSKMKILSFMTIP